MHYNVPTTAIHDTSQSTVTFNTESEIFWSVIMNKNSIIWNLSTISDTLDAIFLWMIPLQVIWKTFSFSNFLNTLPLSSTNWLDINNVISALLLLWTATFNVTISVSRTSAWKTVTKVKSSVQKNTSTENHRLHNVDTHISRWQSIVHHQMQSMTPFRNGTKQGIQYINAKWWKQLIQNFQSIKYNVELDDCLSAYIMKHTCRVNKK